MDYDSVKTSVMAARAVAPTKPKRGRVSKTKAAQVTAPLQEQTAPEAEQQQTD